MRLRFDTIGCEVTEAKPFGETLFHLHNNYRDFHSLCKVLLSATQYDQLSKDTKFTFETRFSFYISPIKMDAGNIFIRHLKANLLSNSTQPSNSLDTLLRKTQGWDYFRQHLRNNKKPVFRISSGLDLHNNIYTTIKLVKGDLPEGSVKVYDQYRLQGIFFTDCRGQ